MPTWKSELLADLDGIKIKFGKTDPSKTVTELHDVDEILLVLQGEMHVTINGQKKLMRAFDCAIIPKNTEHCVESPQEAIYIVARRRED